MKSIEIKAFVPAKNYELSKQFYQDFGFTLASDESGISYFHHDNCSFLLQDFYKTDHAENFMMHLLVEDVEPWWVHLQAIARYSLRITSLQDQPWKMRDFTIADPSGVCWRIGQNISG